MICMGIRWQGVISMRVRREEYRFMMRIVLFVVVALGMLVLVVRRRQGNGRGD